MSRLLHSAKFWTAVIDAIASSLAIILVWFLKPEEVDQVLKLVAIWQPVFIAVIIGGAWEDAADKGGVAVIEPENDK